MSRIRALAAAAAFGLALTACGDAATETDAAPAAVEEATPAFGGSFETVSGSQIDFNSLQGQDTVLWFWAPW